MTKGSGKSAAAPRPLRFVVTSAAQLRLISDTHLSRGKNARLRGSPRGRDGGESAAAKTPTAVVGFASFGLTFEALPGAGRQARPFLPWFALGK